MTQHHPALPEAETQGPVLEPVCSACGGDKFLRTSFWHHNDPICKPCFIVWYDPDEEIDVTDPAQVGALSLKLKAAGKEPWKSYLAKESQS